jgi:hypothetical protein
MILIQCEDWNKPLVERIKKSTDEQKINNIQELIITQLPWPNTFNAGDAEPVHYDNPDWPAGSWEEMGLEVCAILETGGWQKLTPDKYIITGFDSQTPDEKEIISICAKDNPEKSVEFPIIILDNEVEYKSVYPYQGAGGKIIPYPSKAAVGSVTVVNLHIYADNGYALDGGSLKIETAEGGNIACKMEGGVYTFTMPDFDVTLSAKFVNCEAKLESGGGVTYYEHLKDAAAAAQNADGAGGGGVITLLKTPVYIDDTIKITGGTKLTLTSGTWKEQEIHWGVLASENMMSMIEVGSGASLTLDGAGGELIIDGDDREASAALISVAGDFTMKDGATLKGGKNGGGVYVSGGGKFTMDGGLISGNKAQTGGGVAVNGGGVFMMNGGLISGNTADSGGGVSVSGGGFTMDGGEISGNKSPNGYGGGVYVNTNGVSTMDGGLISGNTADSGRGGGVYVSTNGGFTMGGGEISGNAADSGRGGFGGYGGGVYVNNNGSFTMGGGEISGNTATNSFGGGAGVYVSGNLNMSGAAYVAQDNAVYLGNDRQITVTGALSADGEAAKIAIAGITGDMVSRKIINRTDGDVTEDDIAKFAFDAADGEIKAIGGGGWLIPAGFEAFTSGSGASITAYKTLPAAVAGAADGDPAGSPIVITLLKETIDISTTVNISPGKNITLRVPDNKTYKINRASVITAALFEVADNASLTLGGEGGALVIDGLDIAANAALINVAGTFTMKDGVTLKNNKGGGVYMTNGLFVMDNGEISGNAYRGGVYMSGGEFIMNNGKISGNTANSGGGVRVGDYCKFTMNNGKISGNEVTDGGGGVSITNGEFVMYNGEISGNNGSNSGGGVYIGNNAKFTMEGGVIRENIANAGEGVYTYISGTFNQGGAAIILDSISP